MLRSTRALLLTLVFVLLAAVPVLLLAQEATEAPTETPAPTPTFVPSTEDALTIWSDAGRLPALEALGAAFTEAYGVPVRIQTMGFGDVRNNLQLGGPVGNGPDIVVGAHDWLGQLVGNGLVAPIDASEALLANLDPVAVRAFTYDGQLYGLPYSTEAIGVYYNTDLIPELPGTWAEMIDLAQELVDEGQAERGIAIPNGAGDPYHHTPIFTGFGGYVFGVNEEGSYDPTDVGLDSEGGIAAMQEIDRLVQAGLLDAAVDYGVGESLFHEGKLAIWITGPWALSGIRESGVPYAVAPIPTMTETPRPFVGSQGFLVNSFSLNPLLAQAFLTEFVATDEGMQLLYDAVPFIPAWTPIASTIEDADLAAFASVVANGDPMPAIPEMSAVWTAWGNAISLVYQGQADPQEAIVEAAATIRETIANGAS
jgi:maltose/maltodextrin transport system substrate-binding protein/arabinogalactan oligomer/maltooligosaccharide transport system substrate-binding protein